MRSRATLALLFVGAAAATLPTLVSCGARTAEKESTNTGNPPVIDHGEIRIELVGGKVKVTGDAGAVGPGGVAVEVTNLSTNETGETKAKANGAFEVELAGELDDGYSVEISSAEGNASLTLSLVGAADSCGERATTHESLEAQCSDLIREARCQAIEAVSLEFLGCESNDDCEKVSLATSCSDYCDPSTALAKTSTADLQVALAEVDERVCGEMAELRCPTFDVDCVRPAPALPECVAGHCALVSSCAAGVQAANEKLSQRLPELAEGCSVDIDCHVEQPSACDWSCPSAAYVTSDHLTEYESLMDEVAEDCTLSNEGGDTCHNAAMCAAIESNIAVCNAGTCVAGDSSDLQDAIESEIDRLNHCEVVEDCEAVSFPGCSTSYINQGADSSTLDALLMNAPPIACDPSCACGILECVENRCAARRVDCVMPPEGDVITCL